MAAKLTSYEKAENEKKKTSEVSFRFGEKDDLQPTGFSAVGPDKNVTVIMKGKIKSFSTGDEWEKGLRFTINMSSCEILAPDTEVTMDAAIKAANSSRKKVEK